MRFVLTPIGSGGDVRPFIALGEALVKRGHEAVLIAAEPFGEPAARAALQFVSLWSTEEYERNALDPALWDGPNGVKLVMKILGEQLATLYGLIESVWEPGSIVVAHTLAFASLAFAEKHHVPAASVHLAPSIFRSEFEQPYYEDLPDLNKLPRFLRRGLWRAIDKLVLDPMIAPALNRWRAQLGLPAVHRIFQNAIHAPQKVIALFPGWFAARQPDWPAGTILAGFPDASASRERVDEELEAWLAAGDPPIVLTPGTANRQAAEFFRVGTDAARRLGRRALLATPWSEQIPAPLPPTARAFSYAPFGAMLHRCAAFVHHGGIGSCAQGLRSGVPQLVMPMAFDQPDNANRLRTLGVGTFLPPKKFTVDAVTRDLAHLLGDSRVSASCARWRAAARTEDGIAVGCSELERLTS